MGGLSARGRKETSAGQGRNKRTRNKRTRNERTRKKQSAQVTSHPPVTLPSAPAAACTAMRWAWRSPSGLCSTCGQRGSGPRMGANIHLFYPGCRACVMIWRAGVALPLGAQQHLQPAGQRPTSQSGDTSTSEHISVTKIQKICIYLPLLRRAWCIVWRAGGRAGKRGEGEGREAGSPMGVQNTAGLPPQARIILASILPYSYLPKYSWRAGQGTSLIGVWLQRQQKNNLKK